jgi:hypothetical protein
VSDREHQAALGFRAAIRCASQALSSLRDQPTRPFGASGSPTLNLLGNLPRCSRRQRVVGCRPPEMRLHSGSKTISSSSDICAISRLFAGGGKYDRVLAISE